MQCLRCKHENPLQARFCMACGTKLTPRCATCGTELPAEAQFCFSCGQQVSAGAAQSRFGSLDAYTPRHLAEKILTSKAALEGERKQVTVLFADMKGSMELLAERDPEEARRILDPVLERMMEAVHRYEGTVNQVMGDGIMALFGAPLAHEDHAVRACFAALRMREAVWRYSEELRRVHGVEVQIRIGINSGQVVVRSIGGDLRMDYTAVGQTTHLAARMEQLAAPGTIRVTAETLRLAEGYVAVKPLGPIPVKGLETPVAVYELSGAGSARTRLQAAAAARGLTRFVGREAELDQLRQALEQARAGHGQVVAVVGEPGVGKSRLLSEFIHSHRTHGWLVLETGTASYGKATPYLPVIDLLKAYFQVEPRDEARKIREKATGKLLSLDRSLEPGLSALFSLLDVPEEDAQWQAMDPPQRRERTLEGVKRLLLRESQVQPLCLVLEDLHWIDSESQGLLDSLVESLPTACILLLVNYRPEYHHGWAAKTYYAQLRMETLPAESAEELLQALLGDGPGLGPLKQRLIALTQGNPFFLEESVHNLFETQALAGERGAYRLAKALPSIQVPATVQAMLAARIDRLPPDEKYLLQSASVVGETVPLTLLKAIIELHEDELRQGLTHLQTAEFLYQVSFLPELEYTFKHGLTYQVAYKSLLQERRRALHARIVEAIERLYPDRLTEQVERLAHHAVRGEVWDKAFVYSRLAGAKAAGRCAHREAVAAFEQALDVLQRLPSNPERMALEAELRFDLRNSLHPLGELRQILGHLHQARTLANRLGEQRRLGWVSSYMTQYFRLAGAPDQAIESGEQALRIARSLGDSELQIATNTHIGPAYRSLGRYDRAIEILRGNLEVLQGELAQARLGLAGLPSVISRTNLVWCLAEVGEFAEGLACGAENVRIAEAAGHSYSLIFAYLGLGMLLATKGDVRAATPVLEQALALSESWKVPVLLPVASSFLGSTYGMAGRLDEALPLLERSVSETDSMSLRASHGLFVTRLAEGYLLAGRCAEAQDLALRGLALSRELKERGHEAYALHLLGDIAARRDPSDIGGAETRYAAAAQLAEELGMRPLLAHCHMGFGKVYRAAGATAAATDRFMQAALLFKELQMQTWRGEAEDLLADLT